MEAIKEKIIKAKKQKNKTNFIKEQQRTLEDDNITKIYTDGS